jgi:hypothetical protein
MNDGNSRWPAVGKYVFIGFALIGGYFLLTEHRAHVLGALPYLLLLACPLMHLFHKHGEHGSSEKQDDRQQSDSPQHHHH